MMRETVSPFLLTRMAAFETLGDTSAQILASLNSIMPNMGPATTCE